ncbi:hypothetical protein NQ490_09340 [Subdoligranulum variabile]|nr:hypothetical protein [Subdoligranulum variabile]UWP67148.1 hypothetical protein NQ490_09340 [Subdoligranulum variabile]
MHSIRRRLTAWAFCVLLAAGLLVSAWFLVREVRHTCTGADCPVCACLREAARQLRAGSRPAAAAAAALAAAFAAVRVLGGGTRCLPAATLVARKVRLDN